MSYSNFEKNQLRLAIAEILNEKEFQSLILSNRRSLLDASSSSQISAGDTAWMLMSTILVFFMTMPGISLYYCGRVRIKNVLATVMQSYSIVCVITFWWLCWGYSLSFGPVKNITGNGSPIIAEGDTGRFWFQHMSVSTIHPLAPTIPESVFCMYELMFAIVTAALICGSFADRMQYFPFIIFISLWHLCVYCPIAHAVWHPDGFLHKAGVLDYAGGNVVHVSAGMAGLVSAIIIGVRKGFGTEAFEASNILTSFMGMCMLWMGWFGFNAGSSFGANERAGYALLVSQIAAAVGSLSWMLTEMKFIGRPSVLGMIHGSIAGLVAITPASGYVDQTGAVVIGLLSGPVCYFGARAKYSFGYDDALDAFGVHAIGGILGGILTAFFARKEFGSVDGIFYSSAEDLPAAGRLLGLQIYGLVVCGGWSAIATGAILLLVDKTIGLRVSADQEEEGLDATIHGDVVEYLHSLHSSRAAKNLATDDDDGSSLWREDIVTPPVPTI